jgi:hypothetical protein
MDAKSQAFRARASNFLQFGTTNPLELELLAKERLMNRQAEIQGQIKNRWTPPANGGGMVPMSGGGGGGSRSSGGSDAMGKNALLERAMGLVGPTDVPQENYTRLETNGPSPLMNEEQPYDPKRDIVVSDSTGQNVGDSAMAGTNFTRTRVSDNPAYSQGVQQIMQQAQGVLGQQQKQSAPRPISMGAMDEAKALLGEYNTQYPKLNDALINAQDDQSRTAARASIADFVDQTRTKLGLLKQGGVDTSDLEKQMFGPGEQQAPSGVDPQQLDTVTKFYMENLPAYKDDPDAAARAAASYLSSKIGMGGGAPMASPSGGGGGVSFGAVNFGASR